jgi:L-asparaginase II
VHALPLRSMAMAFARVASRTNVPDRLRAAVLAVRKATGTYPHMVSSHGSFNTELLAAFAGDAVAKAGAEALFCAGFAESGVGFAVKIADGNPRATPPIVMRTLEQLGLPAAARRKLSRFERLPVVNCHRHRVGWVEPADFTL